MEYKVVDQSAYVLLMTLNVSMAFVILVMACICCKRQMPKNELLGLEGMVKMVKNPDEVIVTSLISKSESQAELNLSTVSNADSDKRASTAAHRSLPDIPIAEANGDTGSELYETVADKRLLETQGNQDKNCATNLKKQTSVSQHSSISQADDVSSPYSRVKNSPHGYAKVISTEHPYAQLNTPSTSASAAAAVTVSATNPNNNALNDSINRISHTSGSIQDLNDGESQVDIPAASAIAGMISASQDLPYMTPPVVTQHFSGDSQDSSKGYTSISVREPLANILAQQPRQTHRSSTIPRDVNDSHYATVSDDSDETYAAIEDPNLRNNLNLATDIYTSGSETYAQIQPMQSVVVSVEINNISAPTSSYHSIQSVQHNINSASSNIHNHSHTNWSSSNVQAAEHATPIPASVDSLRAQMHSRQASSSSNNSSSVGNLGSPKPEKRQANSPLPPTPKSSILQATSNTNLTSGRSSVISVIELTGETSELGEKYSSNNAAESSTFKKHKSLSPSKDIEGMYAKVMKKNKFSTRDSPPLQGNSPVMTRKQTNSHVLATTLALGVTPLDTTAAALIDSQKISISTSERNRSRCNSYGAKDHGYETIPADVNRKSDCYTNILQKERQQLENNAIASAENLRSIYTSSKPPNNSATLHGSASTSTSTTSTSTIKVNHNLSYQSDKHYETIAGSANSSDPGYETLLKPKDPIDEDGEKKTASEYDPNYEVLKGPDNQNSSGLSDDGYAKVIEKKRINLDEDSIDGYSKVKGDEGEDGYSTIREFKENNSGNNENSKHHNYASISEAKHELSRNNQNSSSPTLSPMPDLLPLSAVSTPLQSSEHKVRPNELPTMLSPSSYASSSLLNTSSAASSVNLTTTSTISTFSSQQTPSSSQYESLTGSDTDPNYESVSYVQTNRSNSNLHAYERLNADFSDTQLSSPRTPDDSTMQSNASPSISTTGGAIVLNVNSHENATSLMVSPKAKAAKQQRPTDAHADVTVDDYFQV